MPVRIARDALLAPTIPRAVRRRRALALDLLEAGLAAVDAENATRACLRARPVHGPVHLFAFGKASVPMTVAALGEVDLRGGVVVVPEGAALPSALERSGLELRWGGHPLPRDDAGVTGRRVLERAQRLEASETALCLVSGGGSAMLELPRDGITLDSLRATTERLLRDGAPIEVLNTVRAELSQLKGGGLARAMWPARVVTRVLSDVPGRPPHFVASGPTIAGSRLAGTEEPTLDVADDVRVVASGRTARSAVVEAARTRGLELSDREGVFSGEARELGRAVRPGAWVWGGETTVTVRGHGRGGRNQELALAALAAGWSSGVLVALATDGVDGASRAAGALVDRHALEQARRQGLDPLAALADNDSATFFEQLGTALHTGPTGTNVADVLLVIP